MTNWIRKKLFYGRNNTAAFLQCLYRIKSGKGDTIYSAGAKRKNTFPILSNKSVCVPCTAVKGAISGFAVALFLICAKHCGWRGYKNNVH